MDDAAFERWSQTLASLRKKRQEAFERAIQERADSFTPAEFFALANNNVETILDQWFTLEQESWQNAPPTAPAKALQAVKTELDSVAEFESQAIDRDVQQILSRITWNPADLEESRRKFLTFMDDLRKKFLIKVKSLSAAETRSVLPAEPARAIQFASTDHSSAGGLASIGMLIVGLLLGGGASIYFMDGRQKAEARCQEEKTKILTENRALADSMAQVQANFADVVLGRSQTMPQIKAEMLRIKNLMNEKVFAVNSESAAQREHLRKRVTDPDRLARALADVESERLRRIKKIEDEQKPGLRVLEKRAALYEDLIGETKKS